MPLLILSIDGQGIKLAASYECSLATSYKSEHNEVNSMTAAADNIIAQIVEFSASYSRHDDCREEWEQLKRSIEEWIKSEKEKNCLAE